MKKETKTVPVFIAEDGKEFFDEESCKAYEETVLKMKYFKAHCRPDLTEGRGYNETVMFAVYDPSGLAKFRCAQWLIDNRGRLIEYVMGVSPMPNWTGPEEIDSATFNTRSTCTKIFLSQTEFIGFPKAEWRK